MGGSPLLQKVSPPPPQTPPFPLQRLSCLLNPWSQRSLGIDLGRHTCRKEGVSEGTGEAFSKKRKPGNRIARLLSICNRRLLSSACPAFHSVIEPSQKGKPKTLNRDSIKSKVLGGRGEREPFSRRVPSPLPGSIYCLFLLPKRRTAFQRLRIGAVRM